MSNIAQAPVILAAQKAEIRRILVLSQPLQIVCKTLSRKYSTQKRIGGVAQVVEPSKCEVLSSNPSTVPYSHPPKTGRCSFRKDIRNVCREYIMTIIFNFKIS
jgi:hypothetical protein